MIERRKQIPMNEQITNSHLSKLTILREQGHIYGASKVDEPHRRHMGR